MKLSLVLSLFLNLALSSNAWAEQKFSFDYANLFASESSMLETARTEADYINTHLLAAHGIEIVVQQNRKHDMSVHTISGVLKGKSCRVSAELFRKAYIPQLRRALWTEMILGVGIIWPQLGQGLEAYRANYVLIPACF